MVKMVHNAIEYGLMQAYAEGFDILRNKDSRICLRMSAMR
jgi:6-phosphogluconate dehydrogenase